jgi:FSR family fosmidomycin resistance protein-like MFS transporter
MQETFQQKKVIFIAAAHHIHDLYTAFFSPLLPLIIAKLNIPLSAAALLHVARNIPSVFNPLLAILAEKRGVKYFVILTPAITAVSMSFIGAAGSFAALFFLLLIAGISAALFHVPSPVMVRDVSGHRVGTGMSYFMVGGEMARTLGPILATAAVSWWGLEGIFRLIPLGLLASLVLFIGLRNYKHPETAGREKSGRQGLNILKRYWAFFFSLSMVILFNSVMKTALILYLPVYLTGRGESLWYAGISLSLLQGFGVAGVFLSGRISDLIGRGRTLLVSAAGTVAAMIVFSLSGNIVLLSFLGFFLFASGPVLMAVVQDTRTSMPTFMNAMYMTINFGISSLIALGIGFMGDTLGLDRTYVIAGLIGIGLIPAAALLPGMAAKA